MNETFIYLDQFHGQHGPFPLDVIYALLQNGTISSQTLISDGIEQWEAVCNYHKTRHLLSSVAMPATMAAPVYNQFFVAQSQNSTTSRALYIVLAIFLGMLGIHNFVAGLTIVGLLELGLFVLAFLALVLLGPLGLPFLVVFLGLDVLGLLRDIVFQSKDGKGLPFA